VSDGVAMVKMLLDLPGMNVLKVTEADGEPVIEVETTVTVGWCPRGVGCLVRRRIAQLVLCVTCRVSVGRCDWMPGAGGRGAVRCCVLPRRGLNRPFQLVAACLHDLLLED
jgi:hypothetical protein